MMRFFAPASVAALVVLAVSSYCLQDQAICYYFTRSRNQLFASKTHIAIEWLHTPSAIEWLHIPKTGTSFGNTLLLWACPDLDKKKLWMNPKSGPGAVPESCKANFFRQPGHPPGWYIGSHATLQNRTDEQIRRVFTFVRSPKTRIASGYHFLISDVWKQVSNNATEVDICSFARNSTFATIALGTQVKMIAGEPTVPETRFLLGRSQWEFTNTKPATIEVIDRACTRLNSFAFVGITEFWTASICLFHKKFGGDASPVEQVNVHRGTYYNNGGIQKVDCGDNADEALFDCALARFISELRPFPDCMKHLSAKLAVLL